MIGFSQAPRAWGFTRGMARTLGLSLTDAVVEGWLSRAELGALVAACQSCGATGACSEFLSHTVETAALPAFCPNAGALTALRP